VCRDRVLYHTVFACMFVASYARVLSVERLRSVDCIIACMFVLARMLRFVDRTLALGRKKEEDRNKKTQGGKKIKARRGAVCLAMLSSNR
jgi:hypothetical protein